MKLLEAEFDHFPMTFDFLGVWHWSFVEVLRKQNAKSIYFLIDHEIQD